jgi:hypothetical protein
MYGFPNATIPCGGSVPGGEPCAHCPDEMPPAFVLSGEFVSDECEDCENYDGDRAPQNLPDECTYIDYDSTTCSQPTSLQIFFTETTITVEVLSSHPDGIATYEKSRTVGDPCNTAHTLQKVAQEGTACVYPDEITITPSA